MSNTDIKNFIYEKSEQIRKNVYDNHSFQEECVEIFNELNEKKDNGEISQKDIEGILDNLFVEISKNSSLVKYKDDYMKYIETLESQNHIYIKNMKNINSYISKNSTQVPEPNIQSNEEISQVIEAEYVDSDIDLDKDKPSLLQRIKDKFKKKDELKDEELTFDIDGPAIKKYKEETEEIINQLAILNKEKDVLKEYATKITNTSDLNLLESFKEEIKKEENNYSDKLKNAVSLLIKNREIAISNVKNLKNEQYQTLIKDIEDRRKNNPNDPEIPKLEKQKQEYEMLDHYIKSLLNGNLSFDKATIETIISNNNDLTPELKEELITDKLNVTIENTMDYDNLVTEYDKDIEEFDIEIKERNNNLSKYRSILGQIKNIYISSQENAKSINFINNNAEKLPDELKAEICKFILKYIINNKKISLSSATFPKIETELNATNLNNSDSLELNTGNKNIPISAPAYEKYVKELEDKKEEKKKLVELKDRYDKLLEEIKKANSIQELEQIKPQIDAFEDTPAYFKDALNTVYNDKNNKLSGVIKEFDSAGPEYVNLEKELTAKNTPQTRKEEITKYLTTYKQLLDMLNYSYSKGMDLTNLTNIISNYSTSDISEELKKELIDKINRTKTAATNSQINEDDILKSFDRDINTIEADIKERGDVIAKYTEIKNKIKDFDDKIQNGLDKDSDEAKKIIEDINKEIEKIPNTNLKNELSKHLEQTLNPKKKITKVSKRKDLLRKAISAIGGFAIGATIGFLATNPLSLTLAGIGMVVGKIVTKRKIKKLKEKQQILAMEQPSEELKEKMRKLKRNEKILDSISIGLTGATIGLIAGNIAKGFVGPENTPTPEQTITPGETATPEIPANPEIPQGPDYSGLDMGNKIGDGFNISQGYDQANWATNGINAETLNPTYVNSDSVIQRVALDGVNTTQNVDDLIAQGIDPSRIAVGLGKNGIDQAWIGLEELTKGAGHTL